MHAIYFMAFGLALEFDPDRFLDERLHKYLTPNPFIFVPFNAGPRICLGQQVFDQHIPSSTFPKQSWLYMNSKCTVCV